MPVKKIQEVIISFIRAAAHNQFEYGRRRASKKFGFPTGPYCCSSKTVHENRLTGRHIVATKFSFERKPVNRETYCCNEIFVRTKTGSENRLTEFWVHNVPTQPVLLIRLIGSNKKILPHEVGIEPSTHSHPAPVYQQRASVVES